MTENGTEITVEIRVPGNRRRLALDTDRIKAGRRIKNLSAQLLTALHTANIPAQRRLISMLARNVKKINASYMPAKQ